MTQSKNELIVSVLVICGLSVFFGNLFSSGSNEPISRTYNFDIAALRAENEALRHALEAFSNKCSLESAPKVPPTVETTNDISSSLSGGFFGSDGASFWEVVMLVIIVLFCGTIASILVREQKRFLKFKNKNIEGVSLNLSDFVAYRIDYWFSISSWSKPLALMIATFLLIFLGGVCFFLVSSSDGEGFSASMWASWTFVADPGTHADQEKPAQRAVAFGLTIGGMLIFALVIGIVAESISEKVDSLKKGRSQVIEADHTLILGFSDKLIPVIQQIAIANESEGGGMIVVLAENPKEELEELIQMDSSLDLLGSEVVCRSGSPIVLADLRKVAAVHARSIIVLAAVHMQNADMSDARAVRVVLSLVGIGAPAKGHIVVELLDVDNSDLIYLVGGAAVENVVAHDVIGRVMIQCSRQPGLAQVYEKLLGFEGNEFYFKEWPELTGLTFGQIHYRFPNAIPIGIRKVSSEIATEREIGRVSWDLAARAGARDRVVELNPPDSRILMEGEQVLVLAEDDDTYEPLPLNHPNCDANSLHHSLVLPPQDFSNTNSAPEKLLFIGWRRDLDDIIAELDKYVPKGSELMLVSQVPIEERELKLNEGGLVLSELKNLTLTHREANCVLRSHLEQLPLEQFNSVMILADESQESDMQTADSRSLASMLLVRDILLARGRRTRSASVFDQKKSTVLISEILDSHTKSMISIANISDYVLSNELVSMAISMVAENRDVNEVLNELFTADGNETYLRDIRHYLPYGSEASFWEIMQLARLRREIAIGYKPCGEIYSVLNPEKKDEQRMWTNGDCLVVLAYD